jgi:hypothetical protein
MRFLYNKTIISSFDNHNFSDIDFKALVPDIISCAVRTMQAQTSQQLFYELKALMQNAIDGKNSCSEVHTNSKEEPSAAQMEIMRLLEIAARAKRRPMQPARPIEATTLPRLPSLEFPPPVKFPRKKKALTA